MGASLPPGVWVGVGSSGTGEMVGVSVGAAVGFAVAAGADVAVGVDVAIGSGVGPEQAARVAMSIRMTGVAWMIVRSTGGSSFFVESTLHSTRLSSQSLRQFLFFAPLLGCSGRRSCPPVGRLRGTWPTPGSSSGKVPSRNGSLSSATAQRELRSWRTRRFCRKISPCRRTV